MLAPDKKSHAKAQRRKEDREGAEGFFALRAFFASLRLCVKIFVTRIGP
jgi:hypothetical protein